MLIESAFYKLPELLATGSFGHDSSEPTVVHFMSLALHMEFDSRNIPRPFDHICPERPYPALAGASQKLRADLYLDLHSAVSLGPVTECYGVRQDNWIETKAYLRPVGLSAPPPKTKHVGKLVRDMMRLMLLLPEHQGKGRTNGRYLLVVAANQPSSYLAFSGRPWLRSLFAEGEAELEIDIGNEEKTFQQAIGPGFAGLSPAVLKLSTRTLVFHPYTDGVIPLFWGYLVRIRDFSVTLPFGSVTYTDNRDDYWDADRVTTFEAVRRQVLDRM